MKKALIFNLLGWLFLTASIGSFFYYWDVTRVHIMGLKSKNSFAYDPLPEHIVNYDIGKTLHISSPQDSGEKRQLLRAAIFGDQALESFLPYTHLRLLKNAYADQFPTPTCLFENEASKRTLCQLKTYKNWQNLDAIHELSFTFDPGYITKSYLFTPQKSNRKLVIYHHGYASTFHEQDHLLQQLNDEGFTIIALNMTSYGDHPLNYENPWAQAINGKIDQVKHPQEVIFKPVFASLNHVLNTNKIDHVYMMGLSAGGWVTAVSAALDPRIEKSYPIAGVLPLALRQGDKERASPQFYKPMLDAASYLDMFVMAADDQSRSQLQIFNRYDRCCFNNVRGKLYEDIVSQNSAGSFKVLIDETHARHKISTWAFEQILEDMNK
ncbi:alpha/beta hydrolase family protein [Candidatus Terasakiella magnetica]|uniref:alpha/beta hydrolase family protein n=1 Tax=Candidatus Terasakiella magnetica TaxID=1867952 RepID=UPI0013F4D663|nr:acetylxylan esterase [Candidatus Terasakiella magnetica]